MSLTNNFARRFVMAATVKIFKPDHYIWSEGAETGEPFCLATARPHKGDYDAKDDNDNARFGAAGLLADTGRFGRGTSSGPRGTPRACANQRAGSRRQRVCRSAARLV
jgi:hypothetical protein